jgi:hypothetical protein
LGCSPNFTPIVFIYRRRRLLFPGFHQESLEENPINPVNPVKKKFLRLESIHSKNYQPVR